MIYYTYRIYKNGYCRSGANAGGLVRGPGYVAIRNINCDIFQIRETLPEHLMGFVNQKRKYPKENCDYVIYLEVSTDRTFETEGCYKSSNCAVIITKDTTYEQIQETYDKLSKNI